MKKNIILLLVTFIVCLVLTEIILMCLPGLNIDRPAYSLNAVRSRFWADINPDWGTWHEKYARYTLIKSCIRVDYQANSYGARDVERCRESTHSRVVVLGDSFMEGYGVRDADRVTNLLESKTGTEYLNFSTSGGFGVTQESILYKKLAKQFDHQVVMIGILPFNDFYDDDPEYGKKVYANRFKPYLVGESPNYNLHYNNPKSTEASKLKSFLRGFTYTYNAWERMWAVLKIKANTSNQNEKGYSGYYDYTGSQLNRLKFALSDIKKEAKGKEVIIFTIPVISDFIRYKEAKNAEPPLSKELRLFANKSGIRYLDLLPKMVDGDWQRYKLPCDNHWSEYGNQVVADILMKEFNLNRWAQKITNQQSEK